MCEIPAAILMWSPIRLLSRQLSIECLHSTAVPYQWFTAIYCDGPGSPCLSKIGPVFVPFSFLGSPFARIHVLGYSLLVYRALSVAQALIKILMGVFVTQQVGGSRL